jgi:hypothetical protein
VRRQRGSNWLRLLEGKFSTYRHYALPSLTVKNVSLSRSEQFEQLRQEASECREASERSEKVKLQPNGVAWLQIMMSVTFFQDIRRLKRDLVTKKEELEKIEGMTASCEELVNEVATMVSVDKDVRALEAKVAELTSLAGAAAYGGSRDPDEIT